MLDTTPRKTATALVFMPARNCESYAADALKSLSRQTLQDIFVLYVDDASDDRTGEIAQKHLEKLFPERFEYIRNASHFGKSRNIWEHLRPRAHLADFIAMFDADDQLIDTSILKMMADSYAAGKDVVWTNYCTDTGLQGGNTALDPRRSPREQRWVSSHFFSFRASLLSNIPESYFKDSAGNWFMGACDVSLAMPILDQTRNYQFIPSLAYRYTASNPKSLHNSTPRINALTSKVQLNNAREIRAKKPLSLAQAHSAKETCTARSVTPPPFQGYQDTGSLSWTSRAANLLTDRFPALLTAQSMLSRPSLAPLEAWAIAAMLEQQEGEVLYLGNSETAVSLAAIIAGLPNRRLTCLLDPARGCGDLRLRLAISGLSDHVEILMGPHSRVSLEGKECSFPNISVLQDHTAFSIVIVDARAEENEEVFAVIALPAVSDQLNKAGFHYCAFTRSITSATNAVQELSRITEGLEYCLGCLGGTGFVVSPTARAVA